jgi:hypothetical protein
VFRQLVEGFGFDEPEVEQLGHETYVRFHKGPVTVSVAWEPGTNPIVEFFYPAHEGDEVVPWASRDGVAYTRRFPRVAVRGAYHSQHPEPYLRDLMATLAEAEVAFLRAPEAT